MKVQYILVKFDKTIFDNFKEEIQLYSYKDNCAIDNVVKVGVVYQGLCRGGEYIYKRFTKDEIYMAVPLWLFEIFTNLIRLERC